MRGHFDACALSGTTSYPPAVNLKPPDPESI